MDNRRDEPQPPYDPEMPTGFANPRPTGDGDPNPRESAFRRGFTDPDLPEAPDPAAPAIQG